MTRPIILDLTADAQGMVALLVALQVPDHVRPVLVLFSGRATQVDVAMAHARDLLRACGLGMCRCGPAVLARWCRRMAWRMTCRRAMTGWGRRIWSRPYGPARSMVPRYAVPAR
ncbi:hypothetical protein RAA17_19900 [Komagataeibacter rhaeticus]|nr:hypothetical protein [Komagataeibacter rhaeticus]